MGKRRFSHSAYGVLEDEVGRLRLSDLDRSDRDDDSLHSKDLAVGWVGDVCARFSSRSIPLWMVHRGVNKEVGKGKISKAAAGPLIAYIERVRRRQ